MSAPCMSDVSPDKDKFSELIEWLLRGGSEFPDLYMKRYSENNRGMHLGLARCTPQVMTSAQYPTLSCNRCALQNQHPRRQSHYADSKTILDHRGDGEKVPDWSQNGCRTVCFFLFLFPSTVMVAQDMHCNCCGLQC